MDLNQYDLNAPADEGSDMVLLNPATFTPFLQEDNETPVTIRLAGIDSDRYRKATNANANARIKSGKYIAPSAEQLQAEGIELLVKCTLAWDGIKWNGETLACTPANVRKIYTQFGWIRDQVDSWMADRRNFLKASSPN
jgi:hypothetical protein